MLTYRYNFALIFIFTRMCDLHAHTHTLAQSAGSVEYSDCMSAVTELIE